MGGLGLDPMEFRWEESRGLFSLEKGGLRRLHIPAGGRGTSRSWGELFKGNSGFLADLLSAER